MDEVSGKKKAKRVYRKVQVWDSTMHEGMVHTQIKVNMRNFLV